MRHSPHLDFEHLLNVNMGTICPICVLQEVILILVFREIQTTLRAEGVTEDRESSALSPKALQGVEVTGDAVPVGLSPACSVTRSPEGSPRELPLLHVE